VRILWAIPLMTCRSSTRGRPVTARGISGASNSRRRRPDVVLGDRGYDHDRYRRLVRDRG
jgi:hypothetical protein